MKTPHPFFNGINKRLLWFWYVPNDEREQTMFYQAYRRAFWALAIETIVLGLPFFVLHLTGLAVPQVIELAVLNPVVIESVLVAILVVAALVGSTAIQMTEIQLKKAVAWWWPAVLVLWGIVVYLILRIMQ